MKAWERLTAVAAEIHPGEAAADIGTDHGYLPIMAVKTRSCPYVVLTDISASSLAKAEREFARSFPAGCPADVAFRVGDGLDPIRPGEVNVIVIAGIGGNLTAEILGRDIGKSRTFPRYILQPRRHVGKLRAWLLDAGFRITGERIVREGNFFPEILIVTPPEEERPTGGTLLSRYGRDPLLTARLDFPDQQRTEGGPLLPEFYSLHLRKQQRILAGMPQEGAEQEPPQRMQARKIAEARAAALTRHLLALGREDLCFR